MTDPRDQIEDWVRTEVTPLGPPPGTDTLAVASFVVAGMHHALVAARLRATAGTMATGQGGVTELAPPPSRRQLKRGIQVAAAIAGSHRASLAGSISSISTGASTSIPT